MQASSFDALATGDGRGCHAGAAGSPAAATTVNVKLKEFKVCSHGEGGGLDGERRPCSSRRLA